MAHLRAFEVNNRQTDSVAGEISPLTPAAAAPALRALSIPSPRLFSVAFFFLRY